MKNNLFKCRFCEQELHRLIKEIKKCEVVCCWCHRLRTLRRGHGIREIAA